MLFASVSPLAIYYRQMWILTISGVYPNFPSLWEKVGWTPCIRSHYGHQSPSTSFNWCKFCSTHELVSIYTELDERIYTLSTKWTRIYFGASLFTDHCLGLEVSFGYVYKFLQHHVQASTYQILEKRLVLSVIKVFFHNILCSSWIVPSNSCPWIDTYVLLNNVHYKHVWLHH